jgi:UDP-GlcNAc:undecaprenyl-phosphate GlcNAc-1-phosphate transferase
VTLALAAAVGYLAGRLLWVLLRPTWSQPLFLRPNYRGRAVPTAAGAVLALTVVMVEGGRAVAGAAGLGAEAGPGQARLAVVVTAAGMALLGMVDDLSDPGQCRGFRGHVGALLRGELTAGGVKAVGGFAVALVAVAVTLGDPRPARLVADAALVALCANLANLFDRAPGRAIKVGVASFLVLAVAAAGPSVLAPAAVVMGAAAALFVDDLHEHLMLGDAGANVLGAVVGLGVVLACAAATRTVVLLVVAALNLVSEVVSFTRVIAAVPPLRALDRAGRRHW